MCKNKVWELLPKGVHVSSLNKSNPTNLTEVIRTTSGDYA